MLQIAVAPPCRWQGVRLIFEHRLEVQEAQSLGLCGFSLLNGKKLKGVCRNNLLGAQYVLNVLQANGSRC